MPTIKLTDRKLRSLNADQHRIEFYDLSLPGFGVRVTKTGRKTFILRYRTAYGRQRKMSLGVYGVVSLAEARDRARQLLASVTQGEDPAGRSQDAVTFGDLSQVFLSRHAAQLSPHTEREYRRVLQKDALPRWGDWKATDVQRVHVVGLLDEIAHDRGSKVMANRTRTILHSLFNFALSRDLVAGNPCIGVLQPAPNPRRDRILSPGEIKVLWNALDNQAQPLRSLVRFLLLTGQRSGETSRMRWGDVDTSEAIWAIPGPERKGGRPHRVPLSDQALAILADLRSAPESEWVFPSPSKRSDGPIKWLSHAAKRLRDASGFEFRIHDLRRTCASGMAELGVDRPTIGKVLGHRTVDAGVLGVYDRYSRDAEMREALGSWGSRVEQIVTGKTAEGKAIIRRIG